MEMLVDMLLVTFPRQLFQHDRRAGHKAIWLHRGNLVVMFCGVRDAAEHTFVTLGRCDFGQMPVRLDACSFHDEAPLG